MSSDRNSRHLQQCPLCEECGEVAIGLDDGTLICADCALENYGELEGLLAIAMSEPEPCQRCGLLHGHRYPCV